MMMATYDTNTKKWYRIITDGTGSSDTSWAPGAALSCDEHARRVSASARSFVQRCMQRAPSKGQWRGERRVRRQDGTYVWLQAKRKTLRSDDGTVMGGVAVWREAPLAVVAVAGLVPHLGSVVKAYLIGHSARDFALELGDLPHEICETMERAVERAAAEAQPGETVLLAPAAASFDQYPNFEKRGDDFAARVKALIG